MLSGLSGAAIAVLMTLGVLLDWRLGEATRWHPLVGFGSLAKKIEQRWNRTICGDPTTPLSNHAIKPKSLVLSGAWSWSLAVVPPVLLIWLGTLWLAYSYPLLAMFAHVLLLYFSVGLRSLRDHTLPIAQALADENLPLARTLTGYIVSRDTTQAQETELANAAVESLLENGNDAVFGTLFWFAIAGGPGALLFRLANTLDAMWGYRTPRFIQFGCAAARIDDVLNFIPARLTACSYVLLGHSKSAWQCWHTQARAWSSPNAGPVMAAGAGALEISLGGAAIYAGEIKQRPPLGCGSAARGDDIARAWRLVAKTTCLWLVLMAVMALIFTSISVGLAHA